MDATRTGISISFNDQCFEKLDVVDDRTGEKSFYFSIDGVEVTEEEWEHKQEQEVTGGLGCVHIRP